MLRYGDPDGGRRYAQATHTANAPTRGRRGPCLGQSLQSHRPARAELATGGRAAGRAAAPEDGDQDKEAGRQAQGVGFGTDRSPGLPVTPGAPSTKGASSLRLSSCAAIARKHLTAALAAVDRLAGSAGGQYRAVVAGQTFRANHSLKHLLSRRSAPATAARSVGLRCPLPPATRRPARAWRGAGPRSAPRCCRP